MKQQRSLGFSLLEMMIVLLIIGIGAATIRVAVGRPDPLEGLEKNAHAFQGWLNNHMDQTLLNNREIGLLFTETQVAVLHWREGEEEQNEDAVVWELDKDKKTSDIFDLASGNNVVTELTLDLESQQWVKLETKLPESDNLRKPLAPQVIVFPSEEYQPSFQLVLRNHDVSDEQINLVADGFNRIEVSRGEQ